MTKKQQLASRVLTDAQEMYLEAYGWKRETRGLWSHPKSDVGKVCLRDALELTRANPSLGW